MKQAPGHSKSLRQDTSLSQHRPVTGPNGMSIAPPTYGIDFVDQKNGTEEPLKSVFLPLSGELGANPATRLKNACDKAYDNNPDCSHAVWAVIKELVNPYEEYRQANPLIDYFEAEAAKEKGKWRQVDLNEGYELAQAGNVVVGGLKNTSTDKSHGHVIVLYPGDKKRSGGYWYVKNSQKKLMPLGESYPLCMSASSSPWPGTKSKGDKTVRDPWTDTNWPLVHFWTPTDTVADSSGIQRSIGL